jgi:aspartyl/asparaginyl-tRNA synthetase
MRINRYEDVVESAKAFGLERFTQKLLGLASVKEASLCPRDRKRTRP